MQQTTQQFSLDSHRWSDGCDLRPFNRCTPHNNLSGRRSSLTQLYLRTKQCLIETHEANVKFIRIYHYQQSWSRSQTINKFIYNIWGGTNGGCGGFDLFLSIHIYESFLPSHSMQFYLLYSFLDQSLKNPWTVKNWGMRVGCSLFWLVHHCCVLTLYP
jgi:hypothetical protein